MLSAMGTCWRHHVRMIVLLGWGFYRSGSCGLQKVCLSPTSPITHFSLFWLNLTCLLLSCGAFYKHVFCAQTSLVKNKKEYLASSSPHFSQVHLCVFVFLLNKHVQYCCWFESCLSHDCAGTYAVSIKHTVLSLKEFVALRKARKPILCQSQQKLKEHSIQLWFLGVGGWHGLFPVSLS